MNVVVFGASGYVGGRLIPVLLERGHSVRAITRSPESIRDHPWNGAVEVVEGDLFDQASIARALEGMDAAYYLVHSMEDKDFEDRDRRAAENLTFAADHSDLERIIYLGGLGRGDLSPHLESRQEVGRILATGRVPVTEFRAAVIIGAGSLSFEMTRYLTEVLPVMVTPSWVRTKVQPIAIADVLGYLAEALDTPESAGRVLEIGGADILTYAEMMQRYARAAGLRRRLIIPVPVLSLALSARWIGLVTPLPVKVATTLVDSLRHEVIVVDNAVDDLIPIDTVGYDEAVGRAIEQTRGADVPTRWTPSSWQPADPLPTDPDHAFGTIFKDEQIIETSASPAAVTEAFLRVGGEAGYYSADWAWQIRGLIDQLFGGAGLRRGRRHPDQVRVGEPLDFWRVVRVDSNGELELKAEMRMPGDAWLGWKAVPTETGTTLVQTAWFAPRGLIGRLYWFAVLPFHAFIFPQMARGIIEAAEQQIEATDSASATRSPEAP